jgi:hypothetical protein
MGKQPPGDAKSIAICAAVLWRLGCPNLRPCQGDPELVKTIRTATYRRTPDLVAGPIRGHGSPHDFFIDVAELQGETLYNPRRKGGTAPPAMLVDPAHNHGTLDAADMPTNHFDGYLSTLNGKLRKYSGERENSPMVGLCVHLDASAMKSGATLGPGDLMRFITRIDYLRFLNAVFGAAGGSVLNEALDPHDARGTAGGIRGLLAQPISFRVSVSLHPNVRARGRRYQRSPNRERQPAR